jgi:hypothetical protein
MVVPSNGAQFANSIPPRFLNLRRSAYASAPHFKLHPLATNLKQVLRYFEVPSQTFSVPRVWFGEFGYFKVEKRKLVTERGLSHPCEPGKDHEL